MANVGSGISGGLSGAAAGTAVAPGLGTAIGAGVGLLGGLLGGSNNSDEIEALQREAAGLYDKFGPVDLSNPIVFQQFQQAGLLSPKMEQQLQLLQDQKLTLQENPENRKQQEQSLGQLKQLAQTGLGPEDLAAFRQLQQQTGQDSQAKQNQILQAAQQRGQASGGNTLAAMLMNAQSSAQQEANDASNIGAQAASARRQALNSLFSGQSQVRSQDFNTDQTNNQNEMLRRQFMDQNAVARQQRNVGEQNQANLYNLNRQQSVGDQNTSVANAELLRQQNAKRQYWADQLAQAQAKGNALTGQASALAAKDANSAQNLSNIFSGVGQLAGAVSKANGGKPLFGGTSTTDASGGGVRLTGGGTATS